MRRKKEANRTMTDVPRHKVKRNPAVLPRNAIDAMDEKKKALSPNPAMGKAVAVPRVSGKLLAASSRSAGGRTLVASKNIELTSLDGCRKGS